jgi:hypothetical protein
MFVRLPSEAGLRARPRNDGLELGGAFGKPEAGVGDDPPHAGGLGGTGNAQ